MIHTRVFHQSYKFTILKTFIWDKDITWFVGIRFPYAGMTNAIKKFTKSKEQAVFILSAKKLTEPFIVLNTV